MIVQTAVAAALRQINLFLGDDNNLLILQLYLYLQESCTLCPSLSSHLHQVAGF